MFDPKSLQIAKMSALDKSINLLTHNDKANVDPKDVIELAEKFVAWIFNPQLKYVKEGVKETK